MRIKNEIAACCEQTAQGEKEKMLSPTILTHTLTARQIGAGLEVRARPDGSIELFRKDETLFTWKPQANPSFIDVQEEADRIMEEDEMLFSFEGETK
jgi:hypothetical protein